MERLTTDKPVEEMGMYKLAHNSCYIDENLSARYRDFETDIDIRELARDIMREFKIWEIDDDEMLSDEIFDETIMDNLQYGTKELEGLIALFYRNLWAMAELRERLKYYEDLEEQGLLLKLPCKVGEVVYFVDRRYDREKRTFVSFVHNGYVKAIKFSSRPTKVTIEYEDIDDNCDRCKGKDVHASNIGKTVFLTKEEAEAKLKEMKGES